jgi:hypothetical protein
MEESKAGQIHTAMAAAMGEIGAVGKNRENKDQGYAFRAIADVYKACQPAMAGRGIHFAPFAIRDYQCEKFDRGNGKYMFHVTCLVEHRFYASDGSFIPVVTIGEATDFSDKASNKAMSASAKYALVQAFCLPEEDPDADGDHTSPEIDAFEPLWAKLETLGLKEPAAVKTWCEEKLGRPLPKQDSLTLADLPVLLAATEPKTPPVRHRASKDEAIKLGALLAHLGVDGIAPTTDRSKLTKAELAASAKNATLAWVNGMRPGERQVGGLLELYADEIIPLIEKAKNGEMPSVDSDPLPF